MAIDLSEFRKPARPATCGVTKAIEALPDGETLRVALGTKDITTASIHQWLKTRGVEISAATVQRHRHQNCRCVQ